jgi:hypothetical protein
MKIEDAINCLPKLREILEQNGSPVRYFEYVKPCIIRVTFDDNSKRLLALNDLFDVDTSACGNPMLYNQYGYPIRGGCY